MSYDKIHKDVQEVKRNVRSRAAGDLQRKILSAMNNSYMGPQTIAWLQNINEDLRVSGSPGEASNVVLNSIAIADKLLDEFQRYAYQYNQNEPNHSYMISCRRPTDADSDTDRYEGFVYNSRSSLLIVAEPDRVTISFVTPRFFYEEKAYRHPHAPFMVIGGETIGDTTIWKLDGVKIAYGQLATVAKKVFARLIRVTRGECSEAEPFEIDFAERPAPAQPQAPEEDIPQPPSRLDIITDSLMTMLEAADAEFAAVEEAGIRSVRSPNPENTEFLLKRSKELREFRQKGTELAHLWAAMFLGE